MFLLGTSITSEQSGPSSLVAMKWHKGFNITFTDHADHAVFHQYAAECCWKIGIQMTFAIKKGLPKVMLSQLLLF